MFSELFFSIDLEDFLFSHFGQQITVSAVLLEIVYDGNVGTTFKKKTKIES